MRVLVAENEPMLANQIKNLLSAQGLSVDVAPDGAEAQYRGQTEPYDVIILDHDLPIRDGRTVFRALRSDGLGTPVVVLTGDDTAEFDLAPDAQLTKPVNMPDLANHVRALIDRRVSNTETVYVKNAVRFDRATGDVLVGDAPVTLTAQETMILAYLFQNVGRLVSKDELSTHLYEANDDRQSNTIAVFVNRLRKKLGNDVIETVRGRGYIIKGAV